MSNRKPLDPKCDGGIFCPIDGHVIRQGTWIKHIPLTAGQSKTLRERRQAQQESW